MKSFVTHFRMGIPRHEKVDRKNFGLVLCEQVERLSETKTKDGAQQLNYERF